MNFLTRLLLFWLLFFAACNTAKQEPLAVVVKQDTVVAKPLRLKPVLILDAGHGGPDPGAINDSCKLFEKNVTRKLVDAIYKKIDTNKITVILTRKKDETIDRHQRIRNANLYEPDLFLSIHNNFDDDTTINGFEINISDSTIMQTTATDTLRKQNPNKDSCVKYASIFEKNIRASFPKMKQRKMYVRKDNIWVLCSTLYPSVMVEFGFITNKNDLLYLTDKKEIDKFAASVVKSIYNIFRIEVKKSNELKTTKKPKNKKVKK